MTDIATIAAAYDAGVEEELNRLVSTPVFMAEFDLVKEYLIKYIKKGSVVMDIGADPGRYTEFLLNCGCKVGAIDISRISLEVLKSRLNENNKNNLLFQKTSCSSKIDFVESNSVDAVLLMGPMYHLTDMEERLTSLKHACRILKDDGVLFCIFMSDYPITRQQKNEETKCITSTIFQGYCIEQFRCNVISARLQLQTAGFKLTEVQNLDMVNDKASDTYLDAKSIKNLLLSMSPHNAGLASQFLCVAKKI